MSILEAGMLVCFGAAWPTNIVKSLRNRSAKGKSLPFLIIVLTGYVFGILNKMINDADIVMVFYIINFIMVAMDIAIWFRNRKLDSLAERQPQ